jgi:hypothetical protein
MTVVDITINSTCLRYDGPDASVAFDRARAVDAALLGEKR